MSIVAKGGSHHMKRLCLIGLAALTLMLVACQRDGGIHIGGRSITLHAANRPAATVTARGSLSVGRTDIDVTMAERQMLIRYYHGVVAVHQQADAMQHAGVAMAGKALHVAGHSIERAVGADSASSTSETAGHAMRATGKQIRQQAQALCHDAGQVKQLQATLAAQIDAFRPYADVNPAPGVHCRDSASTLKS
jgi:hypothetical protein